MTAAAGVAHQLGTSITSEIEADDHETILAGLSDVQVTDLGEVCLRVGVNAAGAIVTLINTMSGRFAVVSAVPL